MTDYALELDDAAVRRFVLAARLAERAERDQWAAAGLTAGATVADVGCGPGAISVLLGKRVEPGDRPGKLVKPWQRPGSPVRKTSRGGRKPSTGSIKPKTYLACSSRSSRPRAASAASSG